MRHVWLPIALAFASCFAAGCSLVYDPNDYVAPADSCDRDRDGHYANTSECGGDDCDDGDGTRYPQALPACDGTPAKDCFVDDMQAPVRAAFGLTGSAAVDFGYLPFHTENSLPAPGMPALAPPLQVRMVGFETADGGQASVAFVAGLATSGYAPRVYLYNYPILDPGVGSVDDPGLGDVSSFAIGGIDGSTARVLAAARGFTGVGTFLTYRDVVTAQARPVLSGGSPATLSGNVLGTVIRSTVAFTGGYSPTLDSALDPTMMWVERSVGGVNSDKWARLPAYDTSPSAFRYASMSAGVTDQTRMWSTMGSHAFSWTDGVASPRVWTLDADSGSNLTESGAVASYLGLPSNGLAPVEPAIVAIGATDMPTSTYVALYVDTAGGARMNTISCTDTGTGGDLTPACIPVGSDLTLDIPNVTVTAVAAAATPGNGVIVALVGHEAASDSGVLLYYIDAANIGTFVPFAHQDSMGRPWLVRPEESNGRSFERIAVSVLDSTSGGGSTRWTVAVAGVSDYRAGNGANVTVTGVVACVP